MSRQSDITTQDKAVGIVAAMRRGADGALTAEFIDTASPLTALLAAEEEAFGEAPVASPEPQVMAYLFSETPHPGHVLRRLYLLARRVTPDCLRGLEAGEYQLLTQAGEAPQHWRISAMLRGSRVQHRLPHRHDFIIQTTLAMAHQRRRAAVGQPRVSLDSLLALGDDETLGQYKKRMEALAAVVQFFFYEGPAPELSIVRVFALAKANHSSLILDMTVRQLGRIFGCTGAVWSWRIKRKYNRFLDARGATGTKARFQKSDAACRIYASVQRGNRNRLRGQRRTA